MTKPLFAIIIPTFNSAKTLQKCLESILVQTFTNFEVLIMDGVSTDATLATANSMKDERIKIYSAPDEGIYDAMNKGIELAKGEWLYFLGSDDTFYADDVLDYVNIQIRANESDYFYGNVRWGETERLYDGEFGLLKLFSNKNICHQSVFIKKRVQLELGLFDDKYPVLADHDLNIKVFTNTQYRVKYIDKVIANYCLDGMSSKYYNNDPYYKDLALKKAIFISTLDIINKLHFLGKELPKNNGRKLLIKKYIYLFLTNCALALGFKTRYKF